MDKQSRINDLLTYVFRFKCYQNHINRVLNLRTAYLTVKFMSDRAIHVIVTFKRIREIFLRSIMLFFTLYYVILIATMADRSLADFLLYLRCL